MKWNGIKIEIGGIRLIKFNEFGEIKLQIFTFHERLQYYTKYKFVLRTNFNLATVTTKLSHAQHDTLCAKTRTCGWGDAFE